MHERIYQGIIVSLIVIIIAGVIYFKMSLNDTEKKQTEVKGTEERDEVKFLNKGLEGISIQVIIKEQTSEGEFKDSLYYTPEEWTRSTSDDVKKSIQKRVENWVNAVKGVQVK